MLGNYRVAAQLAASRVVLSSTELVSHEIWGKHTHQNKPHLKVQAKKMGNKIKR
jgi:hypothetical protein